MELDIEKIMDEIRNEIKERGETADILDFNEIPYEPDTGNQEDRFSMEYFEAQLNIANHKYWIQPYRVLHGNPLYVFIKKVIRKLTKFYIEPIVQDQNEYNVSILRSMNSVHNYIREQNPENVRIKELQENIKLMEIKLNTLQKELDKLNK